MTDDRPTNAKGKRITGLSVDGCPPDNLAAILTGRTIVAVRLDGDTADDWPQGGTVTFDLDDGSSVEISGWGYDSFGTSISFCPSPEANPK